MSVFSFCIGTGQSWCHYMPSFIRRLRELGGVGTGRSRKAKIVCPRLEKRAEQKLVNFFSLLWIAWMVFVVEARTGVRREDSASKLDYAFSPTILGSCPGVIFNLLQWNSVKGIFHWGLNSEQIPSCKTYLNANEDGGHWKPKCADLGLWSSSQLTWQLGCEMKWNLNVQSGHFQSICHLESDFPDDESLACPCCVDRSVWAMAGNKEW